MSLDNNLNAIDVEKILAMVQQLELADHQAQAVEPLNLCAEPVEIPKTRELLVLLQSWEPLAEDFPDIDNNVIRLDSATACHPTHDKNLRKSPP
jgi:hypothetical protein